MKPRSPFKQRYTKPIDVPRPDTDTPRLLTRIREFWFPGRSPTNHIAAVGLVLLATSIEFYVYQTDWYKARIEEGERRKGYRDKKRLE